MVCDTFSDYFANPIFLRMIEKPPSSFENGGFYVLCARKRYLTRRILLP